jgi:hypothetical protein
LHALEATEWRFEEPCLSGLIARRRDAADRPARLAGGTLGNFRIFASDGTTCHMQGTISETGGGDLTVDNTKRRQRPNVTITGFTLNAPGA